MSASGLDRLAWPVLLGRWMDLARASLSLPDDADGRAWQASIEPLVTLQATTFALGDLARIDPLDRPFARDRAAVLVRDASAELDRAWRGTTMPDALLEAAGEARAALDAAPFAAPRVFERPAGAEPIDVSGALGDAVLAAATEDPRGTLLVVPPGTPVMPGAPVLWWTERTDPPGVVEAARACGLAVADEDEHAAGPQVYRELDERGRFVRDVVAPVAGDLRAGLPLLLPILDEGRLVTDAFPEPAAVRRERHRAALDGRTAIPLVHDEDA